MATKKKKSKRKNHNVALRLILFLIVVCVVLCVIYFNPQLLEWFGYDGGGGKPSPTEVVDGEHMEMHVIDVGQGDSILVRTAGGDMLIDTGPKSAEDELNEYLNRVLGEDKTIEYVVFTHPDADHIGCAEMVLTDFTVSNVIMPDKPSTSKTYKNIIASIESTGTQKIEPVPDTRLNIGSMTVTFLAPLEIYKDTNNCSVVMRLDFGETSFMMTGDAAKKSENAMLKKYSKEMLDCDVLKVGHHGSDSSSTNEFLDAVSPMIALISCGKGNSNGHPNAVTLQKLEAISAAVYRTDELGSIILISDGETITIG